MSIITKIVSGDNLRKSRLHDEKGNMASWSNIFFHAVPASLSGILRLSLGYRPELPWISYSSIKLLKSFLNKNSRVLEFGSGMSTLWYSKYAGQVCSVEDNYQWYEKVRKIIDKKKLTNIHYKHLENESEYVSFMSEDKTGFDLIMIDGNFRSQCVANSLTLLNPNGIIYLDNSDKHSGPGKGDTRFAENQIREFAVEKHAQIQEVTDFAPTQFFVQQGLWIKLPA